MDVSTPSTSTQDAGLDRQGAVVAMPDIESGACARGRLWRVPMLLSALLLSAAATGCQDLTNFSHTMAFWQPPETKYVANTIPQDSVTLASDGLKHEQPVEVIGGDFEGARRLFEDKQYKEAEVIFGHIADNNKNLLQIQESARYYQAECCFKLGQYPSAGDHYVQLLDTFPSAAHGDTVRKRMYDIANYWLDETRDQMQESRDLQEGKASFPAPQLAWMHLYPFSIRMHFEDSKPLFDMEGHATRLLEKVYITNPRGEMGEKALFMLASVAFYRERYKAADEYFYDLTQKYPNSAHFLQALRLSIVCKQISTGGPEYDCRRLQEARDLIKLAERTCPELSKGQDQFLTKQKLIIHEEEAERDFGMACFYERTGHPGAAHFYFAIVKSRYPGTEWAAQADKRMVQLRATAQKEVNGDGPLPTGPAPADQTMPEAAPPPRALPAGLR